MLAGGIHMNVTNNNSRYLVLVRLLVKDHAFKVFEVVHCFSPGDAYASPKHIGYCKCVEGNTYAKLKPLLKEYSYY